MTVARVDNLHRLFRVLVLSASMAYSQTAEKEFSPKFVRRRGRPRHLEAPALRLSRRQRPAPPEEPGPEHQEPHRQQESGNVGEVDHGVGLRSLRGEDREKEG
jgi:hypothetical protein